MEERGSLEISLGSGMEIVFHNVGQGLFTFRKLCSFRYVYDCGTNGLQSLLDTRNLGFIQSLGKTSAIDVLIISHMHSDHTTVGQIAK
jgi:glyoxylase-like metal-dependent hydrolase (beta-lactamase superfamily II)